MSAPKFTVGPWHVEDSGGDNLAIFASGWRIAGRIPQDFRANAYLIAAAPDVFEALRAACAWEAETRGRLGLPQIDAPAWVEAARVALAKAVAR